MYVLEYIFYYLCSIKVIIYILFIFKQILDNINISV